MSGAGAVRDRPPGSRSAAPRSCSSESRPGAGERAPGEQGTPTQPTLRRLRQFDVRPDRELGQNFLIDSNILGVIGRLAELSDADVVLEIGGGVGVLSEYLAARADHVHVVEIDERLRDPLNDAVVGFANVTLHWCDALTVDLAALRPAPTKVVANLPYGVAAAALLRTIEELPTATRWVAMVQREVGQRLAAGWAGSNPRAYGVPSVLAQLACRVHVARAIPRTVFYPVPNVDSVLVELTRTGPAATPAVRALVAGAFAHRRKALARSLALAGVAEREQVRTALASMGLPLDVRAERLAPQEFVALAGALDL
ncbi:MAG TPA: 16S rRNA (adenine(1518)-N(6)/adenine(1519)-N(6))-dimethyltransferase RsmA [Solirubrobacteraceae bacterium]|nr:16S rRNA (adenine(1518)-N(6)/adenine(1519)-N(6))-dimethyltransferase RsmA [Solirubrobacteraceae bacterium]